MATAEAETSQDERGASGGLVYDGFISYSHAADDLLAPRLQAGLQRFAKPWWKRRALRIFRDESSLSANPHLWSSITSALDQSAWFVLLLSPDAAESPWVNNEVKYWLEHKSAELIIPVLTDGEFGWDDGNVTGDTVPPALLGVFSHEPRWVDLRFARSDEQLDLKNSQFSAAIADVASAIRGIPKDELASEEVRQHRRTVRTAWAAALALLVLGIAASIAAIVAIGQSNEAQAQRDEAERQTEIALENEQLANEETDRANRLAEEAQEQAELARSRELAAGAINVLDEDPELSVLLALSAAEGADPTFESVSALHEALLNHRTISTWPNLTDVDLQVQNALISPDGTTVARSAANALTLHDAATGEELWSRSWPDGLEVFDIKFATHSQSVVITVVSSNASAIPRIDEGIYVVSTSDGTETRIEVDLTCPPLTVVGTGAAHVALDHALVVTAASPTDDPAVQCDRSDARAYVVAADGGTRLLFPDPFEIGGSMSLSGNGDYLAAALEGDAANTVVYNVASGAIVFALPDVGGFIASLNHDGTKLLAGGGFADRSVTVWDVTTGTAISNFDRHGGFATFWAFFLGADEEHVLSIGAESTIRLWEADTAEEVLVLRGSKGFILNFTASNDGSRALSIASDGVRIWNLRGNGEIRTIELHAPTFGSNSASMAGSEGAINLTHAGSSAFASIAHFDAMTGVIEQRTDVVVTGQSIAVSPDGRLLAGQSTTGDAYGPVHVFDNRTGQFIAEMEGMCVYVNPVGGDDCVPLPGLPFEEWIWNLSFNSDASNLASGGYSRSVSVWNTTTGSLEWNSGLLAGTPGQVTTVAFHPTDDVLAYTDLDEITLLSTTDYSVIQARPGETFVRHMEFTPDGQYLVTATQDSNIVWYSVDNLDEAGRFDLAHDGVIKDLDVTNTGLIVSGGGDGFARIWDMESAQLVQAIPFDDAVQNLVPLNDSELFVTPLRGPGLVMTIDVAELIKIARSRVTRSFSAAECDTYHIDSCPTLEAIKSG